jgi:cyclophilin family peptidyl-prolyl cis-trans isomerase
MRAARGFISAAVRSSEWLERRVALVWLFAVVAGCQLGIAAGWGQEPITPELRATFDLSPHYQQVLLVDDFPVVGSSQVSAAALQEAAWIVRQMTEHRPELRRALAQAKVRLAVMAYNEYTTDIPEHAHLRPRVFWDRRARGLGATPTAPAVSCGEENLLEHPQDPYRGENLCIHEFSHAIDLMAMRQLDPSFADDLNAAYAAAQRAGLWSGTYAISNAAEYFAEGTQAWFDNNRANDALHNDIDTREKLRDYDPALAALLQRVYGDREWRYRPPSERPADQRAHLPPFDRSQLPAFTWRPEPIPERPRVIINTALGDIELELDAQAAPQTVANFLHYVHQGFYSNGQFFRVLRPENQAAVDVPIAVVQGCADETRAQEFPAPIPLERTRDTGLRHVHGTLSMARLEPDTAQHHFFICLGDQPELDFGGRRHPDGQGFAAFGRVVKGLGLLEKVQAGELSAEEPEHLTEPIRIQRAVRQN